MDIKVVQDWLLLLFGTAMGIAAVIAAWVVIYWLCAEVLDDLRANRTLWR